MDNNHRSSVLKINRKAANKTVLLDIPDVYHRDDPELVKLLKNKLSKLIQSDPM